MGEKQAGLQSLSKAGLRAHLGGQSATVKVFRQREGWRGWPMGNPVVFLITFLISQHLESDMKDEEKTGSCFESGPALQGK